MIVLAHIQGVPVEEFLIPWLSGGAGGLVLVLASSVYSKFFRTGTRWL